MIVTCATEGYRLSLHYLLSSYRHSNPGKMAKIYCLGWDEEHYAEFVNAYPYLFEHRPITDAAMQEVSIFGKSGHILRTKIHIIDEQVESFLWVDADTLVLKSIDPLIGLFSDYDFLCTRRKNHDIIHKFALAVIGVSTGDLAKRTITMARDICDDIRGPHHYCVPWFQDQIAFYISTAYYEPFIYSLSDSEHSICGNVDTIFLSRRTVMTRKQMAEILKSMHIKVG